MRFSASQWVSIVGVGALLAWPACSSSGTSGGSLKDAAAGSGGAAASATAGTAGAPATDSGLDGGSGAGGTPGGQGGIGAFGGTGALAGSGALGGAAATGGLAGTGNPGTVFGPGPCAPGQTPVQNANGPGHYCSKTCSQDQDCPGDPLSPLDQVDCLFHSGVGQNICVAFGICNADECKVLTFPGSLLGVGQGPLCVEDGSLAALGPGVGACMWP